LQDGIWKSKELDYRSNFYRGISDEYGSGKKGENVLHQSEVPDATARFHLPVNGAVDRFVGICI
jgi:hypothetical protein